MAITAVEEEAIHRTLTLRPLAGLLSLVNDQARLSPSGAGTRGASQLSSANKCERLFSLAYYHKLTTKFEPDYRLLGTLIHTRLAYHYAAQLEEPPDWFSIPVEDALAHDGAGQRPDLLETSDRVMRMYLERWSPDPWKAKAVEYEFTASVKELDPDGVAIHPGEDDEKITAKVDLYVESNGQDWIVDHKTKRLAWNAKRLPDWEPKEFQLSWQVLLYLNVVRAHCRREGLRQPAGFMIQRVTRELPFDSDRNVVPIPQEPYAMAPKTARMLIQNELRVRNKIQSNLPLVPNFGACNGIFGCDFQKLCAAGPKARPGIIRNAYKKKE